MTTVLSGRTSFLGATAAALALALSGTAALAQDSSDPAHPVHIHSGTCEQLGDVVFPLSNLSDEMLMAGEPAAGGQVGASVGDGLRVSVTTVDAALSDITGAEHAINAHMSDEDIGTYIACGNVGGTMIDDSLAFRLHELSDSGHQGLAWLANGGDGTTTVTLFMWQDSAMMNDESMGEESEDSDDSSDEAGASDDPDNGEDADSEEDDA